MESKHHMDVDKSTEGDFNVRERELLNQKKPIPCLKFILQFFSKSTVTAITHQYHSIGADSNLGKSFKKTAS